jgi:hypothetical protein
VKRKMAIMLKCLGLWLNKLVASVSLMQSGSCSNSSFATLEKGLVLAQSFQPAQLEDVSMHTPMSISSNRASRRLRLGTKSCVECRLRKVRCIFEPNTTVCQRCLAHESDCTPQKSTHSTKDAPAGDARDMQQRMQGLEAMVHRLYDVMKVKPDSFSPFEMNTTEALMTLRSPSLEETTSGGTPATGTSWGEPSESGSVPSISDQMESFLEAPLLKILQEATLIQRQNDSSERHQQDLSYDYQTKARVKAIKALIPSSEGLESILQATEKFWSLWQDCQDLVIGPEPYSMLEVLSGKQFILDSMKSESPMLVAKATLFLALCVQQLPISFKKQSKNLPAPPKALLDSYIRGVDSLLMMNETRHVTVDRLECMTILAKLYINIGAPREGWHCLRRAFTSALLLGAHNSNAPTSDRQKTVWARIWEGDRFVSTILGMPAATTDHHPGVSIVPLEHQYVQRLMYDIATISGHLNQRNQDRQVADYSLTLALDQELQQSRSRVPSQWWDSIPDANTPIAAIYRLGMLKTQFYSVQKLIHLPYMLKSFVDKKYEFSRFSALSACREMIKAYQMIREQPNLSLVMCDVTDFQVFTSAVVIAIDLLSSSSQLEAPQESSDWDLIENISLSLGFIAEHMECPVASQSSQLLNHLSSFRGGAYEDPEDYEVAIPMFGRVKIHRPQRRTSRSEVHPVYENGDQLEGHFMPTLEFSANAWAPFGMTGDILTDEELGIDWASILSAEQTFDWNQTFNGPFSG